MKAEGWEMGGRAKGEKMGNIHNPLNNKIQFKKCVSKASNFIIVSHIAIRSMVNLFGYPSLFLLLYLLFSISVHLRTGSEQVIRDSSCS